ncbi:MAG: hypothetical protein ACUVUF_07835 [Candidatus Bathycorpusculaceae bacterium]
MTESEKCDDENCPLLSNPHPVACPFMERITKIETDVEWIKKLVYLVLTVLAGILGKLLVG